LWLTKSLPISVSHFVSLSVARPQRVRFLGRSST
jgi:hypothetical protein